MIKYSIPSVVKLVYQKVEFLSSYVERHIEKQLYEDNKAELLEKFPDVLVCEVTPFKDTDIVSSKYPDRGVLGTIRYTQFWCVQQFLWLDNVLAQGKKPFCISNGPHKVSPVEPENVKFFLTDRFEWLYKIIGPEYFYHLVSYCAVFEFFCRSSVIQRAGLKIDLQHQKNLSKKRQNSQGNASSKERKGPCKRKADNVVDTRCPKVSKLEPENGNLTQATRQVKELPHVLKGFKLNRSIRRYDIFYCRGFREKVEVPLLEIPSTKIGYERIANIMFHEGLPESVLSVTKQDDFVEIIYKFLNNYRSANMKSMLEKYCPVPKSAIKNEPKPTHVVRFTTHCKVYAYLRAYCYQIIPLELFGSVKNRNTFLSSLKRVCSAGIKDKLRINWFLSNIKTKDIPWLNKKLDISVQTAQLCCVMMFFLDLILKILKGCFYITEISRSNYYPYYYRKSLYQKISQADINDIEAKGKLTKLTKAEVSDYKETGKWYGPGSIRFVPKINGSRPIINVSKAKLKSNAEPNLYWMLKAIRSHFEYLEKTHPERYGSSLQSNMQIYKAYKKFHVELKKEKFSKLYAVKLDITDCFGSIDQDLLLKFVELMHKELKIGDRKLNRYSIISWKNDNVFNVHSNCIGKISDSFKDMMNIFHPSSSHKVYCDWNNDRVVTPMEIMECLNVFVKHCVINVGSVHYRLSKGIAQGGMLSSSMCNIFLSEVERRALKDFKIRNCDFSGRFTDDLLFLSSNRKQAARYYKSMARMSPSMGTLYSGKKTFVNFSLQNEADESEHELDEVSWLGFTMDLKSAAVRTNFSKSTVRSVQYSMVIDTDQMGNRLKKKLTFMALHQFSPLILDTEINGKDVVKRNIFEKCLLFAARFEYLVRVGPKNMRMKFPSFLLGVIEEISNTIILRAKLFRKKFGMKFGIGKEVISWICFQAFKRKLVKRYLLFKPLLDLIKKTIASKRKIMGQKKVFKIQRILNNKVYLKKIKNMLK